MAKPDYLAYKKFMKRLRRAINPQIKKFKEDHLEKYGFYVDSFTGRKVKGIVEVDHRHDVYTFQKLAYDFIQHHKINILHALSDNMKEICELFKVWHRDKAVLRITSKKRNLWLYYNKQKSMNIDWKKFFKLELKEELINESTY